MTQTGNFKNSRWLTAAILKIVKPHISAKNHPVSIIFDVQQQILISRNHVNKKIKIYRIHNVGWPPY